MGDRIITKAKVANLVHALMSQSEVIAPVFTGGQASFRPIHSPDEVQWNVANSTVSPVEYLLPQSEILFHYERRGSEINLTANIPRKKRTILGIRPCDVHSLRMMDRVFNGKFPDPYYLTKRANTMLIALACNDPGQGCFCSSFGTGPSLEEGSGADLLLIELDESYYVRTFSEEGQTLINANAALFAMPTETDKAAVEQATAKAVGKIGRTLDMHGLPEALGKMFDSPYWEKISRKCIACGACTYLCPVCYCFDVSETCSSDYGARVRCWDACTYRSFALLSGGHNPRPTIKESYRQKMYHKFKYAVDRYDEQLCVGCGRCLVSCPVHLDIVRVLTEAKEVTA